VIGGIAYVIGEVGVKFALWSTVQHDRRNKNLASVGRPHNLSGA